MKGMKRDMIFVIVVDGIFDGVGEWLSGSVNG
jgi:hypothetical protein